MSAAISVSDSDRLRWMVDRHVRPLYDAIRILWQQLRAAGVAAPIDPAVVHYVIVGAASLPFVDRAEARLLPAPNPPTRHGSRHTPTVSSPHCSPALGS